MKKLKLFDSHTHLNSPAFREDREAVWEESRSRGVERAVVVGYDLNSSALAVEMCNRLDGLVAAVGISPHDCAQAPDDYLDSLRDLADNPAVVAIGETGLEYHHPVGRREVQRRYFREQILLAKRLELPVIIHSRDSDSDLLEILQEFRPVRGVLHCYTGGVETLESAFDVGLYVSFSGIVTFSKNDELKRCVKATPDDRLLIETDCPYLAPTPHRGRRCVPTDVVHTAQTVADWKGVDVNAVAALTWANAMRLFSRPHATGYAEVD